MKLEKRIRLTFAIVAAALAALAAPAHANTNLGVLSAAGDTLSWSASGLQGSFSERFDFQLANTLGLSGDFSWRNRTTSTMSGFDAKLYTAGGALLADDVASVTGTSSQFNPFPTSLAAGAYYLQVSGTGGGSLGGRYGILLGAQVPTGVTLAVAAVPENSTWVMLASGLLLIGTCAGRRRSHPKSEVRA